MPDLRDASEEEIADALPGVDNDGDLAGTDEPDDSNDSSESDNSDSGSSSSGSSSNDDNIVIGPVRDADTGEIKEPASETGSGDGSNKLGAENFDDDNISSYDPENNTVQDKDDFSNVDTKGEKGIDQVIDETIPESNQGEDNPLTTIEDESGFKIREDTLREKLRKGNTENLGPAQPGLAGLPSDQKFDRAERLDRQEQERKQRINNVLNDPEATQKEKADAYENASRLIGGQRGVQFQNKSSQIRNTLESRQRRNQSVANQLLGERRNQDNENNLTAGQELRKISSAP